MARPLRLEFEGAIYHLCARGNARQRIFHSEGDRLRFLELLEKSAQRFDAAILCFVLMENHFHLVAQTQRANLSRWMHWLMVSYTVYSNRCHCRSGHLFQGRYKSFLVEKGDYLLGLSRYVHLNPVRGVRLGSGTPSERRRRLRRFDWSSYRGYAGLARPFSFVEEEMILGELGGGGKGERLRYRRFTEEGLVREITNPFEAVEWQAVLGSESYLQRIKDKMQPHRFKRREIKALRRGTTGADPRAIIVRIAAKHRLRPERLLRGTAYGLKARNEAMWVIRQVSELTLREIGTLFGGMDYAAVAQRIRRVESDEENQTALQKLLKECQNI
jgi:REP element-mobilizing transposase RayT